MSCNHNTTLSYHLMLDCCTPPYALLVPQAVDMNGRRKDVAANRESNSALGITLSNKNLNMSF